MFYAKIYYFKQDPMQANELNIELQSHMWKYVTISVTWGLYNHLIRNFNRSAILNIYSGKIQKINDYKFNIKKRIRV